MSKEQSSQNDIEKDYSRQLLLAHFSEMSQDWRHLDQKIETALTLYISVGTLVIGGLGFTNSYDENFELLAPPIGIVALMLGAYGFFTVRRIRNASISRDRRQIAINLIKLFFEERNLEISPYLPVYVSTPTPLEGSGDTAKRKHEFAQFQPSLPNGIAIFIYLLNSLLGSLGYLCFTGSLTSPHILVATMVAISLMVGQLVYYFWDKLAK